jgi:hypothetical protein
VTGERGLAIVSFPVITAFRQSGAVCPVVHSYLSTEPLESRVGRTRKMSQYSLTKKYRENTEKIRRPLAIRGRIDGLTIARQIEYN